jgi:dipeptidyl-peptidase-3
VNPVLVPQTDAEGAITSIEVNYVESFDGQMLYYSENYGFLPEVN